MKLFTIKCPKHGKLEVSPKDDGTCPKVCPLCGKDVKRVFDPITFKMK